MNFSKKNLKKVEDGLDIGPVSSFDFSQYREQDWQNVLTCHNDQNTAAHGIYSKPQLWSSANHAISKVQVSVSEQASTVTSVAVSLCGNFGVVGYENGKIMKFLMQSGKEKGLFTLDPSNNIGETLHTGEITGLSIDSLNKNLVSSSKDKTIKLWDFYRGRLTKTYQCDYPVNKIAYNRQNDLVAFASSDLSITLLNARTGLKRVRHFPHAAENRITDICFS